MPASVSQVFSAAGLTPAGVVRWGELIPLAASGVYVVALTEQTQDVTGTRSDCPLSAGAVAELLSVRPELRIDGARPNADEVAARLAALWLPDETIAYIGLAGKSLTSRVDAYYKTPLGARRPHAGGWPLKTLSLLDSLWVHYAPCANPGTAELAMLDAFIDAVSASSRAALQDPDLPLPFANLERTKSQRQRHGISGAREPRVSLVADVPAEFVGEPVPSAAGVDAHRQQLAGSPRTSQPSPKRPAATVSHGGPMRSQRVTEKDIQGGRIRFPSSAKRAFPGERGEVEVILRGLPVVARWHPHYDPGQERSGVLSVGRQVLAGRVSADEVLAVSAQGGRVALA